MAFELPEDVEIPTATTVAGYKVDRLGARPMATIYYAETVADGNNLLGIASQRVAKQGRSYQLIIDDPALLGSMLGGIMMSIATDLVTALSLTVAPEDLLAAVTTIDNVDSYLATAMENLEKARRTGTETRIGIIGSAPAAASPPE
jgi:hypothetical protein